MTFQRQEILAALHTHFGFSAFRPLQEEIVQTLLQGRDCLAILPTGGGKSLCFQLPGLLLPGVTVVISPLISLMADQVKNLTSRGISAVALTSLLDEAANKNVLHAIRHNHYKFVYISPEKLMSTSVLTVLQQVSVSMIVVDEAHCISEWGHQFRPQYLRISEYADLFSHRPVIAAFTASATLRTQKEICSRLKLHQPQLFRQSVIRPNLALHVIMCETATIQHLVLQRLLRRHRGESVILYCATRAKTEEMAILLQHCGLSAAAYHAGQEKEQRQAIQQAFLTHHISMICATTAFGMGVDKPDIRAVIHLNVPASLEGYYQEIGRAGRDGAASACYLLALPSDFSLQMEIIDRSYPPTGCTHLVVQYLQQQKRTHFSFKELIHVLAPLQKEKQLWHVIKRGEEQKWWTVQWDRKQFELSISANLIRKKWSTLSEYHAHQLMKLKNMQRFVYSNQCRQDHLVKYFESDPKQVKCDCCDNCTHQNVGIPTAIEQNIFRHLQRRAQHAPLKPLFFQTLCNQLLASYQPKKLQDIQHLNIFGKGWQHTWAPILLQPDTGRDLQTHVDDSTLEFRSPK